MLYNSGVIVLVISNQPRATCSANLKLLARLLPALYSTQSYYHYLLLLLLLLLLYLVNKYFSVTFKAFCRKVFPLWPLTITVQILRLEKYYKILDLPYFACHIP